MRILEIWRLGSLDAVVNCQQNARILIIIEGFANKTGHEHLRTRRVAL